MKLRKEQLEHHSMAAGKLSPEVLVGTERPALRIHQDVYVYKVIETNLNYFKKKMGSYQKLGVSH